MSNVYFYKSDIAWVVGYSKNDFVPSGSCRMKVAEIDEVVHVSVRSISNNEIVFPYTPIANILKSNDDAYTSLSELSLAVEDFFVNAVSASQIVDGGTIRFNRIEIFDQLTNVNNEYIDSTGFKAIRYRDEYVGGAWVPAGGAAAPDLVNYTIGGVTTVKYSFDGGNTEERLSNAFEMPHDMAYDELNAGELFIECHMHWRPSTNLTGNFQMFFNWSYDKVHAVPVAMSTMSFIETVQANNQYWHHITSFKIDGLDRLPKPAADFSLGDLINFTLRRTPSDTADTYVGDIILEKVALHVPTNDRGSRQRYVK